MKHTLLIAGYGDIACRAAHLLAALAKGRILPARVIYVSTSGAYADDLAAIVVSALKEGAPAGIYNASDDSEIRMGDWFDLVAERAGLARPPRIARSEAAGRIAPELLSFMSESRRLANRCMKDGLGVRLQYPTVFEGVPRPLEVR